MKILLISLLFLLATSQIAIAQTETDCIPVDTINKLLYNKSLIAENSTRAFNIDSILYSSKKNESYISIISYYKPHIFFAILVQNNRNYTLYKLRNLNYDIPLFLKSLEEFNFTKLKQISTLEYMLKLYRYNMNSEPSVPLIKPIYNLKRFMPSEFEYECNDK